MGFYGNITNTSNTTFSFDRIYPNRLAMDANTNNDGIFVGRYVLVEYQEKAAYPVAYHATLVDGSSTQYYFYSSTNKEEISKIKYLGPVPDEPEHLPSVDDVNAIYQDGFYEGEILQYYIYSSEKKDWVFSEEFYKCIGGTDGYAIFEKIETPEMKSDYIQNFEIDENHYGQESKGFKGYDSTVWVKSSVEQNGKLITKYVSIADLNSVVPTFDIAADAPTMTPITPHFDADSTNVYYKLHAQPQWGFRIAQTSADKSDETTQWIKDFYDPATDTSSKKYASGITNGIPNWDSENPVDLNAAIYFNEAGFKKQLIGTDERNGEIKKHSKTVTENTIKIEATGKSGNEYNTHNGKEGPTKTQQIDTQEITINLPAIGNMMSDAWDIIHGPDRDDYKGQWKDENESIDYSSLQGRLNALSDLQVDEIPVKRLRDGQIIGSKINGGKSEQEIYGSLDDAWIQTLVDGNTNTISIHHTFNSNKNGNPYSDIRNKEMPGNDTDNNINLNDGTNTLDINTPIIDATGHVVGKNIETVTLPYGYKHFKTDGLSPKDKEGKDIVGDLYSTVNYISTEDIKTTDDIANSSVAHNTQDILTINPHNKWIQTKIEDTENDGDILTIAHEIHSIDERYDSNTNLNDLSIDKENEEGNLTIYDWDYDEAGHINKKREHTYTLPYGFKTINVGNNNTESAAPAQTGVAGETADNTQDSLTFTPSNKWIKMVATGNDEIKFGHELSGIEAKEHSSSDTDVADFGDTFNILKFTTDKAGHITAVGEESIKIPSITFTNDTTGNVVTNMAYSYNTNNKTGTFTETRENIGTLTLGTHTGTTITTNGLNILNSDTVSSAFNKVQTHINNLNLNSTDSDLEWITDITQANGQIAITRKGTNSLKLNNYSALTSISSKDLTTGDTLNSAFGKLEYRIKDEEKNRVAAIEALSVTDTEDDIKYVSGVSETNGKIVVLRKGTDTLKLNNYTIATASSDVANGDTINNAFGKIQKQIKDIYGNEEIATNFDTIKKIADWLAANDSNADKIIDSIATLNGNDTVSGSIANSIKNAKADILDTKFDYGTTEQKTIAELMAKVAELEAKLNELNNQINPQPDESGETV